ncbi:MAG: DUF2089 family protein [Flavobacteriales bacterium]
MNSLKKLPTKCPSCDASLHVKTMHCDSCQTSIDGKFRLPLLSNLTSEEQLFVIQFLKSSGSIKEMASQMDMSYPTMRNHIDELIEKIKTLEKNQL